MARRDSQKPDFLLEEALIRRGYKTVAGIDEAGRGPLAGPVVAAAVMLDPEAVPEGLNDSKVLKAERREDLFDRILATAKVGIGIVKADVIDQINILQATMKAMQNAVADLPGPPAACLVDGNRLPRLPCRAEAIVKGDARSLSIAAASIIAKVTRDRIMIELDAVHPGYGWASNKGYGTKAHCEALARLGPTPEHRRSFAPVRAAGQQHKYPAPWRHTGERQCPGVQQ